MDLALDTVVAAAAFFSSCACCLLISHWIFDAFSPASFQSLKIPCQISGGYGKQNPLKIPGSHRVILIAIDHDKPWKPKMHTKYSLETKDAHKIFIGNQRCTQDIHVNGWYRSVWISQAAAFGLHLPLHGHRCLSSWLLSKQWSKPETSESKIDWPTHFASFCQKAECSFFFSSCGVISSSGSSIGGAGGSGPGAIGAATCSSGASGPSTARGSGTIGSGAAACGSGATASSDFFGALFGFGLDAIGFGLDAIGFGLDAIGFGLDAIGFGFGLDAALAFLVAPFTGSALAALAALAPLQRLPLALFLRIVGFTLLLSALSAASSTCILFKAKADCLRYFNALNARPRGCFTPFLTFGTWIVSGIGSCLLITFFRTANFKSALSSVNGALTIFSTYSLLSESGMITEGLASSPMSMSLSFFSFFSSCSFPAFSPFSFPSSFSLFPSFSSCSFPSFSMSDMSVSFFSSSSCPTFSSSSKSKRLTGSSGSSGLSGSSSRSSDPVGCSWLGPTKRSSCFKQVSIAWCVSAIMPLVTHPSSINKLADCRSASPPSMPGAPRSRPLNSS